MYLTHKLMCKSVQFVFDSLGTGFRFISAWLAFSSCCDLHFEGHGSGLSAVAWSAQQNWEAETMGTARAGDSERLRKNS